MKITIDTLEQYLLDRYGGWANEQGGLKKSEGLYLLENSIHPTVLVECGFLSNPEECEKLSEKEYQKRLSLSIVYGIIEYMEEIHREKEY